ncbi:unnamed protein product [Triticum aestivum]|uniref:Peptidase C14 caspase domain-containing protein n=1 Tax=Triticum aestivum TaxID=4565 RepID=A0A7H4LNF0_WHEAT|nr:unnamed protein product [Triticum aestivum]
MGHKLALLVGINYPGTKAELRGCHNDVDRMHRCLVDRFGFEEDDIRVLVDRDGSSGPLPTGANIRRALARLVGAACPGDFLFFHFSGHGTRLPAGTGQDDDTGYDECIVPSDMNLITDDDVSELVQKVPDGCIFTIVSDSCHSGGLLEKAKEQIGDSTRQSETQSGEPEEQSDSPTGFRSFLKDTVRDVFKSHSRRRGWPHQESVAAAVNTHRDAQAAEREGRRRRGLHPDDPVQLLRGGRQPKDQEVHEYQRHPHQRVPEQPASADATTAQGSSFGALSNAIQTILEGEEGEVTNRDLVMGARKALAKQGYAQQPGLYCSDELLHVAFIC